MSVRGSWEAFFVFANGANRAVAQPKGVRARPRLPVSIQWSMHGHVMSETSLSLARALAELAQARRRGKRRRALLADRTLQLLVQDLVGRGTAAGMTQRDVALRMPTTKSAVCRLESGRYGRLTLRTIERYAFAVGARVEVRERW